MARCCLVSITLNGELFVSLTVNGEMFVSITLIILNGEVFGLDNS